MILSCTSHRPHNLNNEYDLKGPMSDWLFEKIAKVLEDEKPEKIISGMALGGDMLFIISAIRLGIPCIAAVPFVGQEKQWPEKSQKLHNRILAHPLVATHIVCEGGYSAKKMQLRNIWMHDNSDKILAIWDGSLSGGTYNAVSYAEKSGKPMIRINPLDCPYLK